MGCIACFLKHRHFILPVIPFTFAISGLIGIIGFSVELRKRHSN